MVDLLLSAAVLLLVVTSMASSMFAIFVVSMRRCHHHHAQSQLRQPATAGLRAARATTATLSSDLQRKFSNSMPGTRSTPQALRLRKMEEGRISFPSATALTSTGFRSTIPGGGNRRLASSRRRATKKASRVTGEGGSLVRLERLIPVRGGAATRREAASLVKEGRVEVDGEVVSSPAQRVLDSCSLIIDGEPFPPAPLLVAYHKPIDVLSTMGDPQGRMSLEDTTPPEWPQMGLHPVGRLDADTTGLLLFSSSGRLTQKLLHPKNGVEREYIAHVENPIPPNLDAILKNGVTTAEGTFPAILLDSGEEDDGRGGKSWWVRLSVTEGKYRMVRRILANTGLPVVRLHRVRYGDVRLDDLGLQEGEWCAVDANTGLVWAKDLISSVAG